jgi:hypothetical protein
MRAVCSISGIEFEAAGFAGVSMSSEHPVFSLGYGQLQVISGTWGSELLGDNECRLLCLALARCTGLLRVAHGHNCSALSVQLANSAIPLLVELLDFMNDNCRALHVPDYFTSFVVNEDSESLEGFYSWIVHCHSCMIEYFSGIAATRQAAKDASQKAQVKRLCNKTQSNPELYGRRLAAWACSVAAFPETRLNVAGIEKESTIADYWRYIIECCATRQKDNRLYTIYSADIEELRDHCIDTLDLAVSESWVLIELLKASIKDVSFTSESHFDIQLQNDRDTEYLLTDLLVLPIKANYPGNLLGYLKDKALYDCQQKALKGVA